MAKTYGATVTDAIGARIASAFSYINENGSSASDAQINALVLRFLKDKVIKKESSAVEATKRTAVVAEDWT